MKPSTGCRTGRLRDISIHKGNDDWKKQLPDSDPDAPNYGDDCGHEAFFQSPFGPNGDAREQFCSQSVALKERDMRVTIASKALLAF